LGPVMSTSLVFERAQAEHLGALVLTPQSTESLAGVTADVLARIRQEIRATQLAVVPRRPLEIGGANRFAWWRIDPATGETTGVTDDGLYAGSVESAAQVGVVKEEATVGALQLTRYWVIWTEEGMVKAIYSWEQLGLLTFLGRLLAAGYKLVERVDPSWLP